MAIGYACKLIGIPNTGIGGCTLKLASEDNLRRIISNNLEALDCIIEYNIKNNIRLFRISSDIIPLASHPINKLEWWIEFEDKLTEIGGKIKANNIRVSMHPGQYTVLNSVNPTVVKNAVDDLVYHAKFIDLLRVDEKNKIVLHIGGVYGDKKEAKKLFVNNFYSLPHYVQKRLIIENDDKSYNIEDVLEISGRTGLPVVFDNLHNSINSSLEECTDSEWIRRCGDTWKSKDGKQKIHYSQQKEGAKVGSHSETIFVEEFLEFYKMLPYDQIDIMLEVKDKNLSAVKCNNTAILDLSAAKLEEEWARYKYFVLSRSANIYKDIRNLLKDKKACVSFEFYRKVEEAFLISEDKGAQINAAQHVWGYISKDASKAEKTRYEKLLLDYTDNRGSLNSLKSHLHKCAVERNIEYLKKSLYFYLL